MLLPALSLLVFALTNVYAQGPNTNATCAPGWEWSFNTLKQSPCLVAAYLGSTCNDGIFFVRDLVNSTAYYTGPTVAQANACACSSVFYSALSACADCQGGQVLLWDNFKTSCNTVYASIYPNNIPLGTKVPHWAYQVIPPGGGFNVDLAKQEGDGPESTATTASSTSTPSTSSAPAPSKKSNAGPIAGGVVGGIVLLLAAICAAIWLVRRRRRGEAPSNVANLPMGYHHAAPSDVTPFTSAIPTPKLYDPADPSTFPSSASSAMYAGGRIASPNDTFVSNDPPMYAPEPPPHANHGHRPQYSGAPEV